MIKQSGVKMSNCAKLSDTLKRRLKLGLFIAKFKLIKGQRILTQWVECSIKQDQCSKIIHYIAQS